jgi:hypothetical protein
LADGRRHGRRNVEQLEVGEDLLALLAEFVGEPEVVAGEEHLQPQLVKDDRIAKLAHQPPGAFQVGHVQGEDQALA